MKNKEKRKYAKQCIELLDQWMNEKIKKKELQKIIDFLVGLPDCILVGMFKLMIHSGSSIMQENFRTLAADRKSVV